MVPRTRIAFYNLLNILNVSGNKSGLEKLHNLMAVIKVVGIIVFAIGRKLGPAQFTII